MRILLVCHGLNGGGIERAVSLLAKGFTAAGHHVAIATSELPAADDFPVPEGVPRRYFGWWSNRTRPRWISTLAGLPTRLWLLTRLVLRFKPDVILAKGRPCYVQALLVGWFTGYPVIAAEHTNPFVHSYGRFWNGLAAWLLPRAAARVCLTRAFADDARVKLAWRVIPNPMELDAGHEGGGAARGARILCVGRLDENKNQALALEGFARSDVARNGWRLALCGRGPEEQVLRARARALGVLDNVDFLGYVTDMSLQYRQSSILLLTSRYEGFPYVLLEAFAHGVTVVSTDCQYGPRDVVRTGHNGVLLRTMESPELAVELARLCAHPEERERMAAQARQDVSRYALPRICEEWLDLFRTLLA